MKSSNLAGILLLAFTLTCGVGCGKGSSPNGSTQKEPESTSSGSGSHSGDGSGGKQLPADVSDYLRLRDQFTASVAQEQDPNSSLDEKISACESLLASSEQMISKHPDGVLLSDGSTMTADQIRKEMERAQAKLAELKERKRSARVREIRARFEDYANHIKKSGDAVDAFPTDVSAYDESVKRILLRPRGERAQAYRDEALPALEKLLSRIEKMRADAEAMSGQVPTYDPSIVNAAEKKELEDAKSALQALQRDVVRRAQTQSQKLVAERKRIDDLIASPNSMLFSQVVKRAKPVRFATNALETRSIGCTDGKNLAYIDLNGSDLSKNRFEPVLSFWQKVGSDDSKRKGISSYLYGQTSTTGGRLSAIRLDLRKWQGSYGEFSMSFVIREDLSASLEIKKSGGNATSSNPAENGIQDCELYAEPYVEIAPTQNVIYDCDGSFSLHLNRPFDLAHVVQYKNEKYFFGNPAYCDDYYQDPFPAIYNEGTDTQGQSISPLEPVTVGGVGKFVDRVDYLMGKTPNQSEKNYYRHFESASIGDILGAKPPKTFSLSRTDAANWYTSSDSKCKNSVSYKSTHSCVKR